VSAAALRFARDFIAAVAVEHGDDFVATFDWSYSITFRSSPDATPESVDDCVMVGAIKRSDLPAAAIQTVDGVAFAINIPLEILQASVRRLIDIDDTRMFKLVLL